MKTGAPGFGYFACWARLGESQTRGERGIKRGEGETERGRRLDTPVKLVM